jgi:hypothetical protein
MGSRNYPIRTRHLVPERWHVALVDSAGVRTELGYVPIDSFSTLVIPHSVPDGVYNVEITADGLAWRGLVQKSPGAVTIDWSASAPGVVGLPLFKNLTYDIYQEWIRLKWDGDVPPELSGQVSAGIWIGFGVPDFATKEPTVTIPLFSFESSHEYIIRGVSLDWDDSSNVGQSVYAGVAPIGRNGEIGAGLSIVLPDRRVSIPPAALEEG